MSVYAVSDLHGNAKLAEKILDILKPEDHLFCLGDCIDRGPDGIKILDMFLTDERITLLKGNHEQFMEHCVGYMAEDRPCSTLGLWTHPCNGGLATYEDLMKCSPESMLWYEKKLKALPLNVVYNSPEGHQVILEHAGHTPRTKMNCDPLWNREHFGDTWQYWDDNNKLVDLPDNLYLVHGHTPIMYLKYEYFCEGLPYPQCPPPSEEEMFKETPRAIHYCGGHKIDIDLGTAVTKTVVLLNLDTFEETYIVED